jgi:hypothetical protein
LTYSAVPDRSEKLTSRVVSGHLRAPTVFVSSIDIRVKPADQFKLTPNASTNNFDAKERYSRRQNGGVMYGWRARIGNISPTACAKILPVWGDKKGHSSFLLPNEQGPR